MFIVINPSSFSTMFSPLDSTSEIFILKWRKRWFGLLCCYQKVVRRRISTFISTWLTAKFLLPFFLVVNWTKAYSGIKGLHFHFTLPLFILFFCWNFINVVVVCCVLPLVLSEKSTYFNIHITFHIDMQIWGCMDWMDIMNLLLLTLFG